MKNGSRSDTKKKSKQKEKQIPHKRNPLQDFNGICRGKSSTLCCASTSSSSSTISIEAPKGCLHFLLSSNPSSKTPFTKKPKSLTKFTIQPTATATTAATATTSTTATASKSAPIVTRYGSRNTSKENELPRPFLQKSRKNHTSLHQWQNGKKPMSRIVQRSKLSSDLASGLKNSKRKKEANDCSGESIKMFRVDNNFNSVENLTPVNKSSSGYGLNSAIFDDKHLEEDSNGDHAVKTPPVEVSVSPEIQFNSSTVLISSATPVCYGAGHVLSGVTDKRKCKPRGILTVEGISDSLDTAKDNTSDYKDVNERYKESRPSLIPCPTEASMRWLLSPCDEDDEGHKVDSADKYAKLMESAEVNDLSSPSMCFESESDLVFDSGECNAICVPNTPTNSGKTRIVLLSPKRFFDGKSSQFGSNVISPLSIESLSDGNIIQTPTSDSSSGINSTTSWLKVSKNQPREFKSELDSVAEVFRRVSISPRSKSRSKWDPLGLNSRFTKLSSPSNSINLSKTQKHSDNITSWNSESSLLGNVSDSQMRISWREGLTSRIFEMDELDSCRCLSDEDINVDVQQKLEQGYECKENKKDKALGSPELIDQEPSIYVKSNKNSDERGICAESISTDGGGLVASGDSDWGLFYENQLFKV